jgi:hypothetical protein
MAIVADITAEDFKKAVGTDPIQDDLHRCNCKEVGQIGHSMCGWCVKCNLPVFMCGHEIKKSV